MEQRQVLRFLVTLHINHLCPTPRRRWHCIAMYADKCVGMLGEDKSCAIAQVPLMATSCSAIAVMRQIGVAITRHVHLCPALAQEQGQACAYRKCDIFFEHAADTMRPSVGAAVSRIERQLPARPSHVHDARPGLLRVMNVRAYDHGHTGHCHGRYTEPISHQGLHHSNLTGSPDSW